MVGQVVYTGTDGYQEIVEAEANGARLVECAYPASQSPMYRLEWTAGGHGQHTVFGTWPEAEANFERRASGE